ncbi:MAG: hypothetical protein IJ061_08190 [Lachnospiraceae bacterium]|nr:hypothetical protein [Lachnospiraceae bacterium]
MINSFMKIAALLAAAAAFTLAGCAGKQETQSTPNPAGTEETTGAAQDTGAAGETNDMKETTGTEETTDTLKWWQQTNVYEIYVKSVNLTRLKSRAS